MDQGPLFYAAYLAGAVVFALLHRRFMLEGTRHYQDDVDVYDLAMLNGGPRLAVAVALLELDNQGVIALGDRLLRRLEVESDDPAGGGGDLLTRPDADLAVTLITPPSGFAHQVERMVYQHVHRSPSRQPHEIVDAAAGDDLLKNRRIGLAEKGLLVGAPRRRRLRVTPLLFLPLLVLMGLDLTVTPENNALIYPLMAGAAAAPLLLLRRLPRRTRAGSDLIEHLRSMRQSPSDPQPHAPMDRQNTGMLLALHGPGALIEMDPLLAEAVGISGRAKRGWVTSSGGCGGWAWGGGGGCGGGCGGAAGGGGCGGGGCGGGGCGGG